MGIVGAPELEARFVREMGVAGNVAALVEPVLQGLGFRLVRVRIRGGQATVIEIMAERPDGSMSIEDCRTLSVNLSPLLDVHDPLPDSYRLEVSSPGIDRPLVRPSDFNVWAEYEARFELKEMVDGRKRFRGTLDGYENGEVRLRTDIGKGDIRVVGFPVDLIAEAKLVLTDALVRESLAPGEEGQTGRGVASRSARRRGIGRGS